MYNPKFYTTERNGELALWVEMPNGESYNIYDVSKDLFDNSNFQRAIVFAFERGYTAARMEIEKKTSEMYLLNTNLGFIDKG